MRLLAVGLVIGFGGGAFAGSPPVEKMGREVVEALAAGRNAEVAKRFDPTLHALLSPEKLGQVWGTVTTQAGPFQKIEGAKVHEQAGYRTVLVDCAFARGVWVVSVSFDAQDRIAGLHLMPKTAEWTPPDYGRGKVREREVKVGLLPGTLTLPEGKGPFPALVLVQGSGPHDRDETVGAQKPFKDLALGLAARGVATLRYEKRTRAVPAEFLPPHLYTVKEEVVDDARAAVRLLAHAPEIDAQRVYVLGHSLGGTLAPRIAAGDPEVKGIVILAGATRPLEELVVEQTRYLVPGDPQALARAEDFARRVRDPKLKPTDRVDSLGAEIPGSYWLDLRAYHPAEAAAALAVPILVLQGGRDYQVRRADYDGWARALAHHPHARLQLYPALDHLFVAGSGPSRPEDYQKPGHVDPQVIAEIAAFVKSGR